MARKNKQIFSVNVKPETALWWKQEALKNGFIYDGSGKPGGYLDAIACGDYVLVKKEVWKKIFCKSACTLEED